MRFVRRCAAGIFLAAVVAFWNDVMALQEGAGVSVSVVDAAGAKSDLSIISTQNDGSIFPCGHFSDAPFLTIRSVAETWHVPFSAIREVTRGSEFDSLSLDDGSTIRGRIPVGPPRDPSYLYGDGALGKVKVLLSAIRSINVGPKQRPGSPWPKGRQTGLAAELNGRQVADLEVVARLLHRDSITWPMLMWPVRDRDINYYIPLEQIRAIEPDQVVLRSGDIVKAPLLTSAQAAHFYLKDVSVCSVVGSSLLEIPVNQIKSIRVSDINTRIPKRASPYAIVQDLFVVRGEVGGRLVAKSGQTIAVSDLHYTWRHQGSNNLFINSRLINPSMLLMRVGDARSDVDLSKVKSIDQVLADQQGLRFRVTTIDGRILVGRSVEQNELSPHEVCFGGFSNVGYVQVCQGILERVEGAGP